MLLRFIPLCFVLIWFVLCFPPSLHRNKMRVRVSLWVCVCVCVRMICLNKIFCPLSFPDCSHSEHVWTVLCLSHSPNAHTVAFFFESTTLITLLCASFCFPSTLLLSFFLAYCKHCLDLTIKLGWRDLFSMPSLYTLSIYIHKQTHIFLVLFYSCARLFYSILLLVCM